MEEYKDERVPGKRFEVATDPVAKSRLDSFREEIDNFQQKHPEALGATVFGSMIKGDKANSESDVDAFMYIDAETLPDEEKQKDPKTIQREYRNNFLNDLGVSESEAKKYYGDLFPKLLSTEIIDNNIQDNIRFQIEEALIKKKIRETDKSQMSEEERLLLYSEEPKRVADNFEISGMFHARVGHGIEKYRRMYLEKLAAIPDQKMAENIWRGTYAQISTMEGSYDKSRRLPSTLSDALRTYHPELYNQMSDQKKQNDIDRIKSELQEFS